MTPYQMRLRLAPVEHLRRNVPTSGPVAVSVAATKERYQRLVSGLEERLRKANGGNNR